MISSVHNTKTKTDNFIYQKRSMTLNDWKWNNFLSNKNGNFSFRQITINKTKKKGIGPCAELNTNVMGKNLEANIVYAI